jgi:hypothetical protein
MTKLLELQLNLTITFARVPTVDIDSNFKI